MQSRRVCCQTKLGQCRSLAAVCLCSGWGQLLDTAVIPGKEDAGKEGRSLHLSGEILAQHQQMLRSPLQSQKKVGGWCRHRDFILDMIFSRCWCDYRILVDEMGKR